MFSHRCKVDILLYDFCTMRCLLPQRLKRKRARQNVQKRQNLDLVCFLLGKTFQESTRLGFLQTQVVHQDSCAIQGGALALVEYDDANHNLLSFVYAVRDHSVLRFLLSICRDRVQCEK